MAGETGIFSWDRYYEINENVWISGREIGSGDNLFANVRWISPTASAGVPVGSGFFHQATRPSPKAPSGATDRSAFALDFRPQLDQDTNRHNEAAWMAAAYGSVGIWLPRAVHTSWKISWPSDTPRLNSSTIWSIGLLLMRLVANTIAQKEHSNAQPSPIRKL